MAQKAAGAPYTRILNPATQPSAQTSQSSISRKRKLAHLSKPSSLPYSVIKKISVPHVKAGRPPKPTKEPSIDLPTRGIEVTSLPLSSNSQSADQFGHASQTRHMNMDALPITMDRPPNVNFDFDRTMVRYIDF
jgi:hypothetical protein